MYLQQMWTQQSARVYNGNDNNRDNIIVEYSHEGNDQPSQAKDKGGAEWQKADRFHQCWYSRSVSSTRGERQRQGKD